MSWHEKLIRLKTKVVLSPVRKESQGARIVLVEKSIFVVQKRLIYEKTSIFYEEYDGTKIK